MNLESDYKWVTESATFAFTDDERWEVTAVDGRFTVRKDEAGTDAGEPDWVQDKRTFGSMDEAKAHVDARQNAIYGITEEEGRKDYEAWLRRQPTRDLREMLADSDIRADEATFIQQVISDRHSPSYDD